MNGNFGIVVEKRQLATEKNVYRHFLCNARFDTVFSSLAIEPNILCRNVYYVSEFSSNKNKLVMYAKLLDSQYAFSAINM